METIHIENGHLVMVIEKRSGRSLATTVDCPVSIDQLQALQRRMLRPKGKK